MQLVFPWREYISTFCFLVGINWYVEVPWLGEEGRRSWLLRPGGNLLDATVHLSTFFSFAKPYSIVIQFWLLCTLFGYGCLYSGPSTEFAHSRMFVSLHAFAQLARTLARFKHLGIICRIYPRKVTPLRKPVPQVDLCLCLGCLSFAI